MNKKVNALTFLMMKQRGFILSNDTPDTYDCGKSENPRVLEVYKHAKQILRYLKIKTT